ncbi:hypothetical protein HZB02_04830 [Candidatus Woesearchaeota archaeon]|nr:hypothetical protein [Candidatus Woesearchaeota archaeon]
MGMKDKQPELDTKLFIEQYPRFTERLSERKGRQIMIQKLNIAFAQAKQTQQHLSFEDIENVVMEGEA